MCLGTTRLPITSSNEQQPRLALPSLRVRKHACIFAVDCGFLFFASCFLSHTFTCNCGQLFDSLNGLQQKS
jgi:hypothetical protein